MALKDLTVHLLSWKKNSTWRTESLWNKEQKTWVLMCACTHTHTLCGGNCENTGVKFPGFLHLEFHSSILKEDALFLPLLTTSKCYLTDDLEAAWFIWFLAKEDMFKHFNNPILKRKTWGNTYRKETLLNHTITSYNEELFIFSCTKVNINILKKCSNQNLKGSKNFRICWKEMDLNSICGALNLSWVTQHFGFPFK
jgi:hypothetical protein